MAVEELNAKGVKIGGQSVKFELVAEDDAADPEGEAPGESDEPGQTCECQQGYGLHGSSGAFPFLHNPGRAAKVAAPARAQRNNSRRRRSSPSFGAGLTPISAQRRS